MVGVGRGDAGGRGRGQEGGIVGLFGGDSESNSSQSQAVGSASINSSGWTVGGGRASGGSLEAGGGISGGLPRAAYISAAIVVLAWVYFKNKKGR